MNTVSYKVFFLNFLLSSKKLNYNVYAISTAKDGWYP